MSRVESRNIQIYLKVCETRQVEGWYYMQSRANREQQLKLVVRVLQVAPQTQAPDFEQRFKI